MKVGLGLYRHMLTRQYYDFARQAGCTHVVVHLVDYFNQGPSNPRNNQPTGAKYEPWGVAGDPGKLWTLFGLAIAHTRLGRFEEGLETGLATIRERPESIHAYLAVIQCLTRLDRIDEARSFAQDVVRMDPGFTIKRFLDQAVAQGDDWRRDARDALRLAGLPE